jgi:AraC-like DNA-binding protein
VRLFIKNMVCQRCIMAVRAEAEKLGISVQRIHLGELETGEEPIDPQTLEKFDQNIAALGFERFDDKKSRIIEKVKKVVIENLHHNDEQAERNWSALIASQVNYEYNYISNLFSSFEGITLEQYIIRQKVEKVKELLFYDEMPLKEIAWKLGYSSTAYLTNQFKKVTGMTPGQFRNLLSKDRKPLDKL